MQTDKGVFTCISKNSFFRKSFFANSLSLRKGEIKDTITIIPASTNNLATSDTLLTFSILSAFAKPRSLLSPDLKLSPSNR